MQNSLHARSGVGTLTMIAVIVGVLLVTGIGQAIWRHTTQLGAYCRDAMLSIEFTAGLDICDSIGTSIVSFQRYLEQSVGASSFGDTMNLEEFSGHLARQFTSSTLGFNAPQLSGLIDTSRLTQPSFSQNNPLAYALSSGSFGSSLLQSGNSSQGLHYLQSSASMGDVGILSQLQLGSAYAKGTGGIKADPQRANYYYKQALGSLQNLQRNNSPASQQLLGALPASPSSLQKQLQRITGAQ